MLISWLGVFFASRLSTARVSLNLFLLDSNAGLAWRHFMSRNFSFWGFSSARQKKTEKRNVDSWSKFRIDVFLCGAMFGVPRSIVAEQWKSINKTDTKNEKSMWHTEDSINYRFDTFWFQISFLFSLSVAEEVYLETISLLFRCFGCHRKATRAWLVSQSKRADGRWVIARCRRTVRILRVYRPR